MRQVWIHIFIHKTANKHNLSIAEMSSTDSSIHRRLIRLTSAALRTFVRTPDGRTWASVRAQGGRLSHGAQHPRKARLRCVESGDTTAQSSAGLIVHSDRGSQNASVFCKDF
jgi:hypothetical protein